VEIPVDWVYLPLVEQRRFLWTVFICLKWTSGDSRGLDLSASGGTAETLVDWVYLLPSGPVDIPLDCVYLPRVDQ